MFRNLLFKSALPLFVVLAGVTLVWWLLRDPGKAFSLSVPGMDKRDAAKLASAEEVRIGESFVFFKECPDIPGTRWNRFRGADYDNINKETVPLVSGWPSGKPAILWKKPMGDGHAAASVYDGRIYLLDYDERLKSDVLRCLSLATGEELWNRGYKVHLKRNHGLSRTIPAVSEKFVVSIGPRGQVMCVERLTGKLLWGLDLEKEFSAEIPFWYTGQCPLIDNDTAVIAVGGRALMVGVDCKTGKKAWEVANPEGWKMSHSSVIPMVLSGRKMYVYCAIGGVCGVSASGTDKGTRLWQSSGFSPSVIAPSPVATGNGMILVTAGYGAGSALLKVSESSGKYTAEVADRFKPSEGIASEQQTPVMYKGRLYAILPKDAGEMRNQFVGYQPGNLKKPVMNSGKAERFGLGPYMVADGKFFILNDDGELTIAEVSNERFRILSKTRIMEGQDSWGPLAITGGYLLMRDSKQLVCLDIKAK